MKSTIISMLIVLILLVVLPMVFLGDNGVSEKFGLDIFKPKTSTGVKLPTSIKTVTTDKSVQMYKWRDENGVMQFSSTPPPDGQAERIELTPNLNTMQAVKPPPKEEEPGVAPVAAQMPTSPYTPGGMKQLMDQAGAVKKLMEQQQAQQQSSLDQITGGKH